MTQVIARVITKQFNSPLQINRAQISATGLQIEEGLNPGEWIEEVIKPLRTLIDTMHGSALWWWGDALAYGETRYGEMYSQALEESDYSYNSLRQAKYVSERIPIASRLSNLTWSHHCEVAMAFDTLKERESWLAKADESELSKSELRKAIRQSKAEYSDEKNTDAGQFEHVRGAKELRAYFTREDVKTWTKDRCQHWQEDLKPIHEAYLLIEARANG